MESIIRASASSTLQRTTYSPHGSTSSGTHHLQPLLLQHPLHSTYNYRHSNSLYCAAVPSARVATLERLNTPEAPPALELPPPPLQRRTRAAPALEKQKVRERRSKSPSPGPEREAPAQPSYTLAPPASWQSLEAQGTLSREAELDCCRILQEAQRPRCHPYTRILAQQAQELLLAAHKPYIAKEARRCQATMQGGQRVAPFDDVFLAGIIGLLNAAKRFQPPSEQQQSSSADTSEVGGVDSSQQGSARLLTYAHSYIRKAMMEACYGMNSVYIPRYLSDIKQRVLHALGELQREAHTTAAQQRSNHLPAISMRAIAARAGVTPKAVRDTIHMAGLSFVGSGASEDEEEGDFADMAYNLGAGKFLEQEGEDDENEGSLSVFSGTEALADQEVKGNKLEDVLSQILTQNELAVLIRSMGLQSNGQAVAKQSNRQIAEDLGLSPQRISQIEMKALEKLKKACADPALASHVTELCTFTD